jgi:ABC-type Fe2+-enterobactin transport system substrate-binding protein
MWEIVLPSLQPIADQQGFSQQWQKMLTERTVKSANAAAEVASAAEAARAALVLGRVAAEARGQDIALVAAWAAGAAANAARAAKAAAWNADVWANFDPCGLLERLIRIDSTAQKAV